jgi:hypothetical protein
MKQNYVPTSLGQFLNENRSITLTRKYGQKEPVVIGSRAPLRNQVLSFVAENVKVSKVELKKFITGLNEGNVSPTAVNMWLKRNEKYFVTETKGITTSYKLSNLGQKLVKMLVPETETISESEEKCGCVKRPVRPKRSVISEEKEEDDEECEDETCDFKDKGKKGIHDEACKESVETREERIKKIIENIKAKRAAQLFEEEEEVDPADELDSDDVKAEDEKEPPEEEEDDTEEHEEEETPEEEAEEHEGEEEAPEGEDDGRTEISDFVIEVDDVEEAIAELAELGIPAEKVLDGGEGEDLMGGDEQAPEGEDELELPAEGTEEAPADDFDLELGGEIEGEEEPEVEESVTGMAQSEVKKRKLGGVKPKLTPNLKEAGEEEDELELAPPAEGEEDELGLPPEEGGDELELPAEGGEEIPAESDELEMPDETTAVGGTQIKVAAEHWPKLKSWLENKGVDIESTFGDIEVEGEEADEDEISFDGLEDLEGEEGEEEEKEGEEKPEEEEKEEKPEEEEDEKKEEKKDDKKGGFQPGKKGVNPFPKK